MNILLILTLLAADPIVLDRLGRIDHPPIREASGLVKSRKYPGTFWVHNDSGNPPALFAIRRDGRLIREYSVGVPNVDWEDIATDDDGHLYLGEIGNNGAVLPLRAVYQIAEPDPFADGEKALKVETASYYRFGTGGKFDAEGLCIRGDRALIVAKTFDRREAEIFAIPMRPPAPLLRPAEARRIATLAGFREPVTGADLSKDGRRLVVSSLESVGIYEADDHDGWRPIALKSFRSGDSIEALAWDGDDIVLAGEQRGLFLIRSSVWRGRDFSSSNRDRQTHGNK